MATMPDAALVEALEKCREKFVFYVDQHLAKEPPDYAKAETNRNMVRLCDAALSQPALPREGEWVTVPREPTEAMLMVGRDEFRRASMAKAWTAMLAAAPPAPDLRGEVETDADLLARGWNIAAERAQSAEAQLAEAKEEIELKQQEIERLEGVYASHGIARIAEFFDKIGLGTGDDPIEFLLASHAYMAHERNEAKAQVATLTAQRDRLQERLDGLQMSFEAEGAARDKLQVQLNALLEAGKPFVDHDGKRLALLHDDRNLTISDGEWAFHMKVADFRALKAAHETIGEGKP